MIGVVAYNTDVAGDYAFLISLFPDVSLFVGDLAPDVTDFVLMEHFRQFFPTVRSAKVCLLDTLDVPSYRRTDVQHARP